MITAQEVRELMPKNGINSELEKIQEKILYVAKENRDTLSVDVFFDRFHFFDRDTECLNDKGMLLLKTLQEAGYYVYIREDCWNAGPDFIVCWCDLETFEEKFKDRV